MFCDIMSTSNKWDSLNCLLELVHFNGFLSSFLSLIKTNAAHLWYEARRALDEIC